ncbi:hypothetical protein [Allomuricauda sp. SCSIO 65647]|uniref:hypothetical protein n=1 Tax=Allomuricauda sp. SCSIO 65647 TaxID=2908843 RepID=UPI001F1D2E63|nr:hypothetical protein [Muricauda sp. SCSIO 65647]UJH67520.1 hypothetical protein L0P89_16420 [Muricauda sp. SCSIO 65647]
MKTKNVLPLPLFMSFFFLNSCSNGGINFEEKKDSISNILDKQSVQNAPLKDKLTYKEFHLTSLMAEVIKVNPDFDKISEFKTSKGERPAVYIKSLLLENDLGSKDDVDPSVDAFTDLEGETWHPVLTLINQGVGGADNATFAVSSYNEDTGVEFVKAYQLNEVGELELVDEDYTEDEFSKTTSSKGNLSVYSLSLVECGQQPAAIKKIAYQNCGRSVGTIGIGGGTSGISKTSLKITKMKIKDKKESWLEKADVQIYGWFFPFRSSNCEDTANVCPQGSRDYTEAIDIWYPNNKKGINRLNLPEYRLSKYSNRDVRKERNKTINKHLMYDDNRPERESGVYLAYVIYEYDGWPAPRKYISFNNHNRFVDGLPYRSYNQKYHFQIVRANRAFKWAPAFNAVRPFGTRVNNSVIEYTYSPEQ